jgi:branched-chain amino acid transport system permease protein
MTRLFVYLLLSLPLVGAYTMLAIGIVVVFRASKVLNLAHGGMAVLPAYAVYEASHRGLPMVIAVPIGVAVGALLGALVERFFVRPLARQGPTAQTVGTVAVYGVVVAGVAQVWGSSSKEAPHIFPEGGVQIVGGMIRWGQLGLFAASLACAVGFYALFKFTRLGLALRGAAENPRAAGLMGIDPDRMARLAWMLGGSLAALAGILLAAVTSLQPYSLSLQMLPAFVAALIGGFASVAGAVIGGAIVGATLGAIPALSIVPGLSSLASQVGMPQLVLTIIAIVVMFRRGGRFATAEGSASLGVIGDEGPHYTAFDPAVLPQRGGRRRTTRYIVLALLIAWPVVGLPSFLHPLDTYSVLGDAILAGEYFMAAASIVMLTGWVGQISLSQATFLGISGFGSALLSRRLGIGFPVSLILGASFSAAACALLGVVALRVRGLYLAVATLIFAWMADEYLFVVPWFAGKGGSSSAKSAPVGLKNAFPFFDFTQRKTFYFVMLAAASSVLFGLLNLRDSKTGRAFFALRGSETAAASLGIDVVRYKLFAFATAGFVAGLAGNLLLAHQVTIVPEQFSLRVSLLFLAIAVVGGLRSLGGAIAASIAFAGLTELFFRVPSLGQYLQLVSAVLLALILLVYPKGLAGLPGSLSGLRNRLRLAAADHRVEPVIARLKKDAEQWGVALGRVSAAMQRRAAGVRNLARGALSHMPLPAFAGSGGSLDTEIAERRVTGLVVPVEHALTGGAPASALEDIEPDPDPAEDAAADEGAPGANVAQPAKFGDVAVTPFVASGPVIEAAGITVRFGGLTAVQDASLTVRAGQIVGLIGPNGAGKTTLFNAISGLNSPTSGRVSLFGSDVTDLPVHQRASNGLARTFQVIQLFPELTVFENLLVATHIHNPTSLLSNVVVTAKTVRAELAAEETCRRVVRFLGLEDIADRAVAGLPFGTLRMIEIGRALVTGAPALMLDEPASGLDNNETDRLSELLRFIRAELGVSILLIEHDVKMVTGVSDYMYVLNRGQILAHGIPADIKRNPDVVAAYLGEAVA